MRLWKAAVTALIIPVLTASSQLTSPITQIELKPQLLGPGPEYYVEFSQQVKDFAAQQWNSVDKSQHERAYCLKYELQKEDGPNGEYFYYVSQIVEPVFVGMSTPFSIWFTCTPGMLSFHVHPATTCRAILFFGYPIWNPDTCKLGGTLAYQCQPSTTDRNTLQKAWRRSRDKFAVVQCDKNSLVPYYPR